MRFCMMESDLISYCVSNISLKTVPEYDIILLKELVFVEWLHRTKASLV